MTTGVGNVREADALSFRVLRAARIADPAAREKEMNRCFAGIEGEWYGRIFGYCLRRLGHYQHAEDATQEVFLRAWKKLDTFRADAGIGTWLCGIAVTVTADQLRSPARRRETTFGDEHPFARSHAPGPEETVIARCALEALPEGPGAAWRLWAGGYSARESAEALGWDENRVNRARATARRALDAWWSEDECGEARAKARKRDRARRAGAGTAAVVATLLALFPLALPVVAEAGQPASTHRDVRGAPPRPLPGRDLVNRV